MKLTVCCVYTSVQFFVVKMAKSAPTYSSQTDLKSFVTKHVLVFIYQSSSLYCLVTEFAAGGDLLSFVRGQRDGRLGEVSARRFVRQLVSALHHMHDRGVVHRYVPPPFNPPPPHPIIVVRGHPPTSCLILHGCNEGDRSMPSCHCLGALEMPQ